jgi:hypothetical protein
MINLVNADSIKLYVSARDLLLPPSSPVMLPPTPLNPGDRIAASPQVDENGRVEIQWFAEDTDGDLVAEATVSANDGGDVQVSR